MDITIYPNKLSGTVAAIPSKSQAHRLLICAAFADRPTELICPAVNRDIEATADCLNALGATVRRTENGYCVKPATVIPKAATLNCCESGSTLRFMLPVAAALGVDTTFLMAGRLPSRPLSPLWEEMERMGCRLTRPTVSTLHCAGKLQSGTYQISGSVSSQFITGLLLACSLLPDGGSIRILGRLESEPYVQMTCDALQVFGVTVQELTVLPQARLHTPGKLCIEGDWSNGAFFLGAQTMGNSVHVTGLDIASAQGDRAIKWLLPKLKKHCTVSAADIPDLVPIMAVVAASHEGAVFTDIGRLRIKESDRVASVIAMLTALGGNAEATQDTLQVFPCRFTGGTVDSFADHRIAMAAAIAATLAQAPVTVLGADCVKKSYPGFWEDYQQLGGHYEQHIR